MSKFLILAALLLVFLVSQIEAHHSVRVQKPSTEAEREAWHIHHRAQRKPKELVDVADVDPQHPETSKLLRKSDSYHFAWGPEYPAHPHVQHYKPADRFYKGLRVPDFISDEDLAHHY